MMGQCDSLPKTSSARESTAAPLPQSCGEHSIPHALASPRTTLVTQFDSSPRTYSAEDAGVVLHVRPGSLQHGQVAGPITIEDKKLHIESGGSSFLVSAVVDCQPSGSTFDTALDLDFRVNEDLGEQDDDNLDSDLDEDLDEYKKMIRDTYKVS